jgi:hypothetical protein
MSSNNGKATHTESDKEHWLFTLFFALIKYLIVKPIIFLMLALGRPCKGPLSRILRLPAHSGWWRIWGWLLKPIQWGAGIVFFVSLIQLSHIIHMTVAKEQFLFGLQQCLMCLASAISFDIFAWLEEYANDPDTQKHLAGQKAEQLVRELVDDYRDQSANAQSLHGALFVFHPGAAHEFSVEVDHLLVTHCNVFVIETKYKSGAITAAAEASDWEVETSSGSTRMRNALKQAKNAARVLQQQLTLACEIVPVVAIAGNEVRIVNGPTNVVTAYDLPGTLHAFEFTKEMRIANPAHVLVQLQKYISTDPAAMRRHIARAETARIRNEMAEIVQAASLQ